MRARIRSARFAPSLARGSGVKLRDPLRRSRQPRIAERALALVAARRRTSSVLGRHRRLRSQSQRMRRAAARSACTHAVLGNHDFAALENFGVEYFNDAARDSDRLDAERARRTQAARGSTHFPTSCAIPDFLLVHGAPVNYFEYILDKRTAAAAFARTDAPLVFIGHTHIAEYWVRRARRRRRPQAHAARRRA